MSDTVSGRKKIDVGSRQRSSRETASRSSDMSVYKSSDEGSVRYKGSKESSVYKSSDEFFEYSCDPCSSAGDQLEAEGFCTNCGEYLCGMCFRSHSRGKATKHHKLLNKDNMPRKQVQTCDPCKTAGEEIEAIGYCANCEEYLCSSCFRSHSRSKATKHHNLIGKDDMTREADLTLTSSVRKMNIDKGSTGNPKENEEYTHIRDVSCKAKGDMDDCYITAMTIVSDTELVLADYQNKSLKLVDTDRNVIKGTLDLESPPFGLTTVSKDEVAVSLSNINIIQLITIVETMSVHRTIKTVGIGLDIKYFNEKIYASFFKPVNFKIFRLSGEVYKTIKPDNEVLKRCTEPRYIAISPDECLIYVSDWRTNTVLCIDMNGSMIYICQNELDWPNDITISTFGSVYLCSMNQQVVYKITPDMKEATIILGRSDGLVNPTAICINTNRQHLYISRAHDKSKKSNCIKVFKWK